MTFEEYLLKNYGSGAIDHALRVDRITIDGHPKFYIHAQGKDSDTLDFVVIGNGLLEADANGEPKRSHLRIEPQPQPLSDGTWPIHSADGTGKWFRPAGLQTPGVGIYPLFDAPTNMTHAYCEQHAQWEWICKYD